MSIKKTLLAGVAGTLLAGGAMAAEPMTLSDSQMDDVAAGLTLTVGLGFTGGFQSLNSSVFQVQELSQTSTVENSSFNGTNLQTQFTTQAAAGTTWDQRSDINGGIFAIGPAFALGASLSFDEP